MTKGKFEQIEFKVNADQIIGIKLDTFLLGTKFHESLKDHVLTRQTVYVPKLKYSESWQYFKQFCETGCLNDVPISLFVDVYELFCFFGIHCGVQLLENRFWTGYYNIKLEQKQKIRRIIENNNRCKL